MYIPTCCPRCHSESGWHEKGTWKTGFPIGKHVRFGGLKLKGLLADLAPQEYIYHCDNCGYENAYNDRPETLGR